MADKRKLQSEIDRCLKTVSERLEIFQETWDRVESASNGNQKEKYEGDLKKEIKKLQRLRDQIKTWLAGNEAKTQRQVLLEHRRLIEVQMERFKVMERQAKTKAFSKEGLAAAAVVDPRQKERNRIRDWLNDAVNTLKLQIDGYEAEIEMASSGKKSKKKSPSEKEARLKEFIERHEFHISKLEMLMRMIDKSAADDPDLDKRIEEAISEDLQYYVEQHQDEDYLENEYMYEDFEALLESGDVIDATKMRQGAEMAEREARVAREAEVREREEAARAAEKAKREAAEEARREEERARKETAAAEKAKAAVAKKASQNAAPVASAPAAVSPKPSPSKVNFAAAAAAASAPPNKSPQMTQQSGGVAGWGETAGGPSSSTASAGMRLGAPPGQGLSPQSPGDQRGQPQGSAEGAAAAPLPLPPQGTPPMQPASPGQPQARAPKSTLDHNLRMLMASSMQQPEQPEQSRGIATPNPHSVPPSYPDTVPTHFSRPEFFSGLEPDTLFFIFYHLQGTYQQYLAARELKNQAWRFHKKYLTWFQRFEEPKMITDEYEQGTYIYFDWEAGWCQRKKTDFTFEYCFLEDQDLTVPN
mmetsp:Transcript_29929/g.89526  ORF Transcript_29929/g.89526 Transcript_29929/m.89526 type:complete len:587 (-) Transcript_29929:1613-3373(-)